MSCIAAKACNVMHTMTRQIY